MASQPGAVDTCLQGSASGAPDAGRHPDTLAGEQVALDLEQLVTAAEPVATVAADRCRRRR